MQEAVNLRGHHGGFTWSPPISQPGQSPLFEPGQVVVNRLDVTIEMGCQLSDRPTGPVQTEKRRSQTRFRVGMSVKLQLHELELFLIADNDLAGGASHSVMLKQRAVLGDQPTPGHGSRLQLPVLRAMCATDAPRTSRGAGWCPAKAVQTHIC